MKYKIHILLFLLLNCFNSRAQNLFVADYVFPGSNNQTIICYDHSFFTTVGGGVNGILTAMKTDSAGNVQWSYDIDYPPCTFFTLNDVKQAADSGFLILLNIWTTPMSHANPAVTKLDKAGNYQWTKSYISVLSAHGSAIIKNNDNGFMVAGSRQVVDFFMKCDDNGNITWLSKFIPGNDSGNDDVTTHDYNRFVVAGTYGLDFTFFETDLLGNVYWLSTITFPNTGGAVRSIKPVSDGGYIATGVVKYNIVNNSDAFLAKTDSIGNLLWLKVYSAGFETLGIDVTELSDSSLVMICWSDGSNGDGLIIKTDKDGNYKYAKTEVIPGYSEYTCVDSYSAGALMLAGRCPYSFIALADTACSSLCQVSSLSVPEFIPASTDTFYNYIPSTLPFAEDTLPVVYTAHPIVRNVLCGFVSTNEVTSQNEINIYPNPVTDKLNITVSNIDLSEIILYDITSRKLLHQKFTSSITLNTEQLANGIYVYEVINKNGVVKKGKVIKD